MSALTSQLSLLQVEHYCLSLYLIKTEWVGLVEAQVYIKYATLSTLILCMICAPQTQPYLILFLLKL